MTREQSIEASKGPGKFEGCPIYAPYFWELSLDGGIPDENVLEDIDVYTMDVEAEDRAIFPELTSVDMVSLWEDDNGFIYLEV
jgi:hypothetical protein